MTRGCAICQTAPAKRSACCGQKLCGDHELKHDCPRARELLEIADDPKRRREWLKANAPEEVLTTEVIAALNREVPGFFWRTKRKQGPRQSDEADGVLDVQGFAAPDGIAVYVETKRTDRDDCGCASCVAQRRFAERAIGAGAVAVLAVRAAQQAIDGVRMGLARVRGRSAA